MKSKWLKFFFWRKFLEALDAGNYELALVIADLIEKARKW